MCYRIFFGVIPVNIIKERTRGNLEDTKMMFIKNYVIFKLVKKKSEKENWI